MNAIPSPLMIPQRSVGKAYALWLLGLLGVCGIHRLYVGKIATGAIWVASFGCFFVGQLVDLFLIPGMVDEFNTKQRMLHLLNSGSLPALPQATAPGLTGEALMREILRLASQQGGRLTASQVLVHLDAGFEDVEKALVELTRRDYAISDNNLKTGAVEYYFPQLER